MLDLSTFLVCWNCKNLQSKDYNFCGSCGKQNQLIYSNRQQVKKVEDSNLKYLSYYTLVILIFIFATTFLKTSIWTLGLMTVFFAFADLTFAFLQPKVFQLINFKNIRLSVVMFSILFFVFSGILVSWLMTELNYSLFDDNYLLLDDFVGLEYPLFWAIIIYGIFPAFFEELAFRGFVFTNIEKIRGRKAAIIGSTFLFALVHLSLFSLLWIIPFALVIAYLRIKHNTLVYGMIGHFSHNTTTILLEYFGFV